jgi:hypothetical protein
MRVPNQIKNRVPARSLSDVEIPDSSWKPDFDIADRYQNFANELMRISLLGIAGYGFLIKEVVMADDKFFPMIGEIGKHLWIGALFLAACLSLVLVHRFLSTDCLYYQSVIMRSLKRLENQHWNETEKESERLCLDEARGIQKSKSKTSHYVLIGASVCFAIGFIYLLVVFFKFLEYCTNLPIQ